MVLFDGKRCYSGTALNIIFNNRNIILLSAEGNEGVSGVNIVLRLLVLSVCPTTFEHVWMLLADSGVAVAFVIT